MNLFRIHIRPSGGSANMKETFEYCKKNNLLGVGWRTESNLNTSDWDKYYNEASKIHDNLDVCKYIKNNIKKNDLVWTRDRNGEYYLAKVISGWEYFMNQEAIGKDIDIANIFRIEFKKVDIEQVPGKVVACFRAPRTIQRIADKKAIEYSKFLWNKISKNNVYKIDKTKFSDIFMMFDDEETEDLVFLYLQSLGWYVVPNSRKADTMSFEYLAVNPKTGERALTQIKTGDIILNKDDYKDYGYRIFLFQSKELYEGKDAINVIAIKRDQLTDFLNKSMGWLPTVFKTKLALVSGQ